MNQNQSNPNPAAQALGRLGRGHKKTLTDQERQRRADWARGLAGRHVYVCQSCANIRGFEHTQNYGTIIAGELAKLIRTPSTRLKVCADCRNKFRDIWRIERSL